MSGTNRLSRSPSLLSRINGTNILCRWERAGQAGRPALLSRVPEDSGTTGQLSKRECPCPVLDSGASEGEERETEKPKLEGI
jgi:hypothetical protein